MKSLEQLDAKLEKRTPISTLPFAITQPGSYYLPSNLTGVAGQSGITISADGVTLDLMGFELVGVPGSVDGVRITGNNPRKNIAVRNGTVRNWGGKGVGYTFQLSNSQFENLRVSNNGDTGLDAGSNSTVRNCTVQANGGTGIDGGNQSIIRDCAAESNGSNGITVHSASRVSGCSVRANNRDGIYAASSSVVSGNTAVNNERYGIRVGSGCHVIANTCSYNGTLSSAGGAGIHVDSYVGGSRTRIEANHVTDNDRGIDVDSSGNLIIKNSASGNSPNWEVAAGNVILVIEAATAGSINGNSGGVSPGSTNPNANYTY
jgi:parallel beta-helix repeat protein